MPAVNPTLRTDGADAAFGYAWNGVSWVETVELVARLAVTATGASGAAVTLTVPAPGAGLFLRLAFLQVVLYRAAAGTGSATPLLVTTTGLPGNPVLTFPTAGAIGTAIEQKFEGTAPLRATTANTAATIVCPVATGGIWRANAFYFSGA